MSRRNPYGPSSGGPEHGNTRMAVLVVVPLHEPADELMRVFE